MPAAGVVGIGLAVYAVDDQHVLGILVEKRLVVGKRRVANAGLFSGLNASFFGPVI